MLSFHVLLCSVLYPGGVQWQPWREVDGRKPATVSRGYSWERGGHEELGRIVWREWRRGQSHNKYYLQFVFTVWSFILLGNWQVVWWHELADCALFEGSPGVTDTSYLVPRPLQIFYFVAMEKIGLFSMAILEVAWEPARLIWPNLS